MNVTSWLVILSLIGIGLQAHINRRSLMGQLDDIAAAVAAAKAELADDIAKVSAKIEASTIPQAEKDALIGEIAGFGTALDVLAGDLPEPPVEPPEPVS